MRYEKYLTRDGANGPTPGSSRCVLNLALCVPSGTRSSESSAESANICETADLSFRLSDARSSARDRAGWGVRDDCKVFKKILLT